MAELIRPSSHQAIDHLPVRKDPTFPGASFEDLKPSFGLGAWGWGGQKNWICCARCGGSILPHMESGCRQLQRFNPLPCHFCRIPEIQVTQVLKPL